MDKIILDQEIIKKNIYKIKINKVNNCLGKLRLILEILDYLETILKILKILYKVDNK